MENRLNQMKIEGTDTGRSLKDPWELSDEVQGFNAETLLAAIMIKGAQLEPLWSDPVFFYRMNAQWWNKWYPTFDAWCKVLEKEYNPLWNKEYWEKEHQDITDVGTNDTVSAHTEVMDDDTTGNKSSTEIMDDDITYSKSGTSTEQLSGKDKTTHNSDRDISVENKVSAFDSNTYQPHDQSHTDDTLNSDNTETTYGKKIETTYSENGSGTDDKTTTFSEQTTGTDDRTTTFNGTIDNDTTNDRDHDRDLYAYGNIGVTSSQQLLTSELQVRYWNIYEHMSDIFLDEMAVRVF